MPAEQLIMRMISSLGQVDNKKLQTGHLENEDWRRINEGISQLADTNVFFPLNKVYIFHERIKHFVQ